jgi:hypothetical protein
MANTARSQSRQAHNVRLADSCPNTGRTPDSVLTISNASCSSCRPAGRQRGEISAEAGAQCPLTGHPERVV